MPLKPTRCLLPTNPAVLEDVSTETNYYIAALLYFSFSRVVSGLATNRIPQYNYDYQREYGGGERAERATCKQGYLGFGPDLAIILNISPESASKFDR